MQLLTNTQFEMTEIFIIIGLILLNGVFSMSEIALVSARKSRLTTDAKNGDKGAKTALNLADDPDKFLSTVQIGITLIGILTGIFSGATIAVVFADCLKSMGLSNSYAVMISQTLIVVVVTYLTIVFGELLPKRLGMARAEKIAKLMSRPMNILAKIMSPFVMLLSGTTAVLFRVFGLKDDDQKVTEDEIKSIVQEGTEDGVVQPVEQDLVERIFMIGDLNIDSIMTHRNDVVSLRLDMTADDVRKVLADDMFDSYPVVDGDLDDIKGVVKLKDLVLSLSKPGFNLASILSEPMYFYEGTGIYSVLELMKERQVTRGLVVDEYGSCIGVITLKDIMEGLVGALPDSVDDEPEIVKRDGADGWLVSGSCTMIDFLTYFDKEEDLVESNAKTVAGLCINHFKHIPRKGESFDWKNFHFEIVDMDRAKIDSILVTVLPEEPESEE